jgi:hypothetical protein
MDRAIAAAIGSKAGTSERHRHQPIQANGNVHVHPVTIADLIEFVFLFHIIKCCIGQHLGGSDLKIPSGLI